MHFTKNRAQIFIAFCIILFVSIFSAKAAPGDLDPTFGSGGKVTTAIGTSIDISKASALQPDGKIILTGFTRIGFNNVFSLVRYNTDGSLDSSFGNGGKVTTDFEGSNEDVANAVAVQPDGKIVAAGYVINDNSSLNFALVRYNSNGLVDVTFGNGGKVVTSLSTNNDEIRGLGIQSNGQIIAVGYTDNGFQSRNDFALVRYNSDGSLDTSFDGDGKVFTHFGNSQDEIFGVVIQPDGKIIAAGFAEGGLTTGIALARYNIDGSPDTTFDGDGRLTTTISGSSYAEANAVILQTDNKIVIAGRTFPSTDNAILARYNPDGSLDTSFNSNGVVLTPGAGTIPVKAALQSNGKIVMSGTLSGGSTNDFAVFRFNTNGSPDTGFGAKGRVTTFFGFNIHNDNATSILVQPDDQIIVSGYTGSSPQIDFAAARYSGETISVARLSFFDFDGDGKSDISVFRPSASAWYLLQSQSGFNGVQFGVPTDKIVPADFDGDGKTDIAVFRDGNWYRLNSSDGEFNAVPFGINEDLPRPGDFDGDGKADIAVFRPSNGTWYWLNSSNGQFNGVHFGTSGDIPLIADFDGDGKADLTIFRPSNGSWYWLNSSDGQFNAVQFGTNGDVPAVGDFDGDGKTDISVFRPSAGSWYRLNSSNGQFVGVQFGVNGDVPAVGDFDGDGKSDIAVFRPSNGTWYLLNSQSGFTAVQFGANGDNPIPAAFLP